MVDANGDGGVDPGRKREAPEEETTRGTEGETEGETETETETKGETKGEGETEGEDNRNRLLLLRPLGELWSRTLRKFHHPRDQFHHPRNRIHSPQSGKSPARLDS